MEDSLEYMAARLRNIRNLEAPAPVVRKPRIRSREAAWQPPLMISKAGLRQKSQQKALQREYGG